MSASAAGRVECDRESGVLTIRLDRPQRGNALDEPMQVALRDALEAGASDPGVAALVLTGSGDAFCSGLDRARLEPGADARRFRFDSHRLTELVGLIERVEKPVIAAVNGAASGLGVQLVLACDLRVGGGRARFSFAEGRLGLLPTHGGVARLVKLVGLARARDILLSSRPVDAERALALGLLTEVVDDADLLAAARELARDALGRAPQSYGLLKRLLLLCASTDLESGMLVETLAQSQLLASDDHREGLAAAAERREPRFTGR